MTQQEIEAFALQYHGIRCVKTDNWSFLQTPFQYFKCINSWPQTKIEKIELRSIQSLTDEELNKVAALEATGDMDIKRLNASLYCLYADTSDYLRSIGIAVPFRDFTVQEMVDQGILKIKS